VLRYGLFETLDKDHFYPSIDAALAAIRSRETSQHSGTGAGDP